MYNFADLRLLHSIETLSNPSGLLALSAEASNTVLACPGLHQGEVSALLAILSLSASGLVPERDKPGLVLLLLGQQVGGEESLPGASSTGLA